VTDASEASVWVEGTQEFSTIGGGKKGDILLFR
jgi:hypothetical protein